MAAKKKNTRRAKTSAKPEPTPQPDRDPEPAQGPLAGTAGAAPVGNGPGRRGPPVAGIGASAGGLDAFKKFFAAMPAESGIAFVLVPHLDPTHESLMVELLARHTSMPVVEAADGTAVEANRVYVIPPNKYMTIAGGVLRLTGPVERGGSQTAIDLFLCSLAEDKRERAICVILSGTGSHGALGLKAVKVAGGLTAVQDPATAEYPLMPRSAIATGLADYVLPVEQMPEALIQYTRHSYANGERMGTHEAESRDHLDRILALLRVRTKLDFRHYRKKMLTRRIERRMSLSHFDQLSEYLAYLGEHPDEVQRLAQDLLISVTSFFRDAEAWHALETDVIGPLVRAKEADAPLRAWSVGCATGEEAYSLGMLLLEQLAVAQKNCPVQIFATDVDEDALNVARQGTYAESIAADVSPQRLARFFTRPSDSSYQVSRQLREVVTFARQNLLADAPFSKLDLVVCRNLLIYLEPEVQKKILELLHFALNEGGCLFLGSSETIGRNVDRFEPIAAKRRIYRRIGPVRADNLQFPVTRPEPRRAGAQPADRPQPPPRLAELAQGVLLRRFALACVVINRNHEVLHFAGPTEGYLAQPGGPPTRDLLALARPGLEPNLRVVIQRAIRQNAAQSVKDVLMRQAGVTRRVNIDVEPLDQSRQTEGLLLVSFQEQPNREGETLAESKAETPSAETEIVHQLEQELETTRDELQSTIGELESSNEELKASNEEILSMNEELQSTNEELETSKEELQSLNEELNTVNNLLQDKVQELETANNDMANLFNSTDVATVFLDLGFRIKRFTPAATRLFKLIAADVGRPLSDIAKRFSDDDLLGDARELLRELTPREKEVPTEDGRWFLRRIVPYCTLDHRIDGVVITFVDITARKHAEDALVRRLAAIIESSADAIFSKRLDGTIDTWNQGAVRLFGYTADEAIGRSIRFAVPDDRAGEWDRTMARLARGEHVEQMETERLRKDGRRVPVVVTYSPIRDAVGKVVRISAIVRDVSERKRDEEALRESEERLRRMMENAHVGIAFGDSQGRIIQANRTMLELAGWSEEDLHAGHLNCQSLCRPEDSDQDRWAMSQLAAVGRVGPCEKILIRTDGAKVPVLISALRLDVHGEENVTFVVDLTPQKQAQEALLDREARLRAILDTAADAIVTIDHGGIIRSVNSATEQMFGYTAAEMIGQSVNMLMPSPYREAHDGYIARYLQTGEKRIIGISREVQARRKDGSVFPADLAVSEIEHLQLFTGILRDLTERKQLERDVVEAASLEQRRIGQDLHDSVAQELTALNLLAKILAESVQTGPAETRQLVDQVERGLQRSQQELRAVLRGLLPVAVDSDGLMAALSDLADRTRRERQISCTYDCPQPVSVTDNLAATQLYFIAQEAVHNAVKHAQAQEIRIILNRADASLVLRVQDDGTGLSASPAEIQGMGLRIMRNRAAIIGATLTIEPAQPTGTVVTCALTRKNHGQEESNETG